jgi:hypothetical protein
MEATGAQYERDVAARPRAPASSDRIDGRPAGADREPWYSFAVWLGVMEGAYP